MQNSEKIREIEKEEITEENTNQNDKINTLSANLVRVILTLIILSLLLLLKGFYGEGFKKVSDYYQASPYFMFKEEEGIIITE